MKKSVKVALIVAAVLIALGIVMCAAAFGAVNFKLTDLSNERVTIETFMIDESFESIKINTNVCSLRIEPSLDGSCHVESREINMMSYNYDVQNNTLVISEVDTRRWYEHIGFNFAKSEVALLLPQSAYNALIFESDTGDLTVSGQISFAEIKVDADTSDISLDGITAQSIKIDIDTGDVLTKNVNCDTLICDTTTGDVKLNGLIAVKSIDVSTDTGDVTLDGCDAQTLDIDTDTGNVKGTLLSDKTFETKTDTGHINVPKTTADEKCKITTDTGDIKINIE